MTRVPLELEDVLYVYWPVRRTAVRDSQHVHGSVNAARRECVRREPRNTQHRTSVAARRFEQRAAQPVP